MNNKYYNGLDYKGKAVFENACGLPEDEAKKIWHEAFIYMAED